MYEFIKSNAIKDNSCFIGHRHNPIPSHPIHLLITVYPPSGERLGLWILIPQQLIVEVGIGIVYMVTGGQSLARFYSLVCTGHSCTAISQSEWIVIFGSIHLFLSQVCISHRIIKRRTNLLPIVISMSTTHLNLGGICCFYDSSIKLFCYHLIHIFQRELESITNEFGFVISVSITTLQPSESSAWCNTNHDNLIP